MRARVCTALLLAAVPVFAAVGEKTDTPPVAVEVTGFRVPDYDERGNLRALLFAEHARMLPDGEVEIRNLRIDLYREGKVVMTLYAPRCFFDPKSRTAHSDGRVLAESEWMRVTGLGFTWSAAAGRFEILREAKVLVNPSARGRAKDIGEGL